MQPFPFHLCHQADSSAGGREIAGGGPPGQLDLWPDPVKENVVYSCLTVPQGSSAGRGPEGLLRVIFPTPACVGVFLCFSFFKKQSPA